MLATIMPKITSNDVNSKKTPVIEPAKIDELLPVWIRYQY